MLGTLVTLFFGGLMVVTWIAWVLFLMAAGQIHRWTKPPHGPRCACDGCVRAMERLAKQPTPPPLPKAHFRSERAWFIYRTQREELIAHKTHYGFVPERVDPHAPLAHDPEPAGWAAANARAQARIARDSARAMRRIQIERIQFNMRFGYPVTEAERRLLAGESRWPFL